MKKKPSSSRKGKRESRFRFLRHTTDLEFESNGKDFETALENAGLAAFSGMTNLSLVSPNKKRKFTISPRGDEITVLYDFLDRLIFLADSERMFFSKFSVKKRKAGEFDCIAYGERISEKKHEAIYIVKAVTYHGMSVVRKKDGSVVCRALLDI